jgi:hypothetical protein
MGIGDFLKKQLDKQVEKGNAERNFAKNVQDLSFCTKVFLVWVRTYQTFES